ncbi:MAG: helix-turn-helix transcriptional regulator [Oscillibacter sp.]|nr:helix-turn-helix transcriptional regulator [Oscillibacter sp.]
MRGLPFSYDYLRKLFKKEIGVTPHRYLNDLRLQVAAQYLAGNQQGGLNVAEISRLCGFREPLYFSRMFKKKYGMSPTAYSAASSGKEREIPDSDSMKIML